MNAHSDKWWGWLFISAITLVLDQVTKQWVIHTFSYREVLPVLPSFNLTLAYNSGAAFSFLAGAGGWQRGFFTTIAVVASVVMIYLLHKYPRQRLFCLAISLILGGALGNLWDRLTIGQVVDFLDFYVNTYHWPAFNIADSAIVVGAGLLMADSFRTHR